MDGATLYLEADVNADGAEEAAQFDLSPSLEISPRVRTGYLIGPRGSSVGAAVDLITGDEQGRAGFRLDAGGGALVFDVSAKGLESPSAGQWGDGSDDPAADATGSDPFHQMSVLLQYLNVGVYDSAQGAGTFEWGEYSSDGAYTPVAVTPEEPQMTFSSQDQASTFDISLTLVATRSIEQAAVSQAQDSTR
jgi:hypothetical protein